ncbi:hypothetical protein ACFVWL_00115 [Microbacterium sp. NPDC058269]|uniref:hypothetical protein n=1 Tax=Microbacterium sp. NPDC058269 TaxID=3346414 RepID=UPI0036DF59F7
MSRRQWRALHRPPIRRGDPVIEFAEWSLPVASVIMLIASFGIAKRGPVPREISAIVVIGCAAVIVLVMFALSIRLWVKRGTLPFSRRAALALAGVSIVSPLVLSPSRVSTTPPPERLADRQVGIRWNTAAPAAVRSLASAVDVPPEFLTLTARGD